ncbi:MAG: hypothetical protein ACR2H5_24890, partial [Ktedonobacteraceae bacterium]
MLSKFPSRVIHTPNGYRGVALIDRRLSSIEFVQQVPGYSLVLDESSRSGQLDAYFSGRTSRLVDAVITRLCSRRSRRERRRWVSLSHSSATTQPSIRKAIYTGHQKPGNRRGERLRAMPDITKNISMHKELGEARPCQLLRRRCSMASCLYGFCSPGCR